MIKIKTFCVSVMQTNCYLIEDTESNECALVDVGELTNSIKNAIKDKNIKYILLTHGHFDHIGGVNDIKKLIDAKIVINEKEKEFLCNDRLNLSTLVSPRGIKPFSADILLNDNDELKLGNYTIKMIETSGHTSGGCCYIIDDNIFAGDTLMKGTVGRTDFPTGSMKDMMKSIEKLKNLKGNYNVYGGHGDKTQLDYERFYNPYMGTDIYGY